MIIASKPAHSYESTDVPYDEDAAVFFLEFLIKIALQNRSDTLHLSPYQQEDLTYDLEFNFEICDFSVYTRLV